MSYWLTDKFWDLLGPKGHFLCKLFHNQSELITQLQMANNALKDSALEIQSNSTDATAKAVLSIAQAILTNLPSRGHSLRSTRAAEPESFTGSRDKAKQFV